MCCVDSFLSSIEGEVMALNIWEKLISHATCGLWLIMVHFFVMQMSHHMSFLLVEMLCLLCCTCYRLSGLSANAHKLIYLFNWVLIHYAHNFVCKFILLIRWWSWMSARVWCYKMAPGHWRSLSHSREDANELCSLEMQKLCDAFDFEE